MISLPLNDHFSHLFVLLDIYWVSTYLLIEWCCRWLNDDWLWRRTIMLNLPKIISTLIFSWKEMNYIQPSLFIKSFLCKEIALVATNISSEWRHICWWILCLYMWVCALPYNIRCLTEYKRIVLNTTHWSTIQHALKSFGWLGSTISGPLCLSTQQRKAKA